MADTQSLLSENRDHDEPEPSNLNLPQNLQASRAEYPLGDSPQVNDAVWTVIFAISVALVCLSAVVNLGQGLACSGNPVLNLCGIPFSAIIAMTSCAVLSAIFAFVWVNMISRPHFSSNIIGLSISLNICIWSIIGLVASAHGVWYMAVFAMLCSTAYGLFYVLMRHRLDFTSVLLNVSFDCLKQSDSLLRTVLTAQIIMLVYNFVWLIAISNSKSPLFFLFMFINQIWTANIIISIVYVISSGVVMSWSFQTSTSSEIPVCTARACNFGSICFGSLAVAIAQTLRILAQGALQTGSPGSCLAACIFGILEYISNFVTRFAFSYVAIWGVDFCSAVEHTSSLLRTRSVDVFVNYNFASFVVWASSSIGGLFGVCMGSLVYVILGGHSYIYTVVSFSYTIGFSMTFLALTMIESMVNSLMVIWAEVPDVLSANRPSQYQSLVSALTKIYPATETDSNI